MKFSRPMDISSLMHLIVLDHQASLAKDPVSRAKHHLTSLAKDPVSLVRGVQEEVGVIVVVNTKGVSK